MTNSTTENGDRIYIEKDVEFTTYGATLISSNTDGNKGGGIYTEDFTSYTKLSTADYQNITTSSATVFLGNKASDVYMPPAISSTYSNIRIRA